MRGANRRLGESVTKRLYYGENLDILREHVRVWGSDDGVILRDNVSNDSGPHFIHLPLEVKNDLFWH